MKIHKEKIDFKKAFTEHYMAFSDKLHAVYVRDIETNKKIKLTKILNAKNLYVKFIDANIMLDSPSSTDINYMENFKPFSNIDIIYIIVNSTEQQLDFFKKIRKLKYPIFYIKKNDYKDVITLGCSYYPLSILFNKKGELIRHNIFPFDLEQYDN